MDITLRLNKEQEEAITHGNGPLLIVAGAGTGKTTVITKRLAYLVEKGFARTDEILALTFTDKATGEMVERIDTLLPYGYLDLWIYTFHAFCQRILKEHGIDIGLSPDFTLLDETGQWLLIRKHLSAFKLDYYRPLGKPAKFIRALVKHFGRLKDEAITPEDYLSYVETLTLNSDSAEFVKTKSDAEKGDVPRIREVAEAYHTYQQLLLQEGALDFGDLILYTLRLLRERPLVLSRLREKFKYLLVDEFQDTNSAQFELIKLLGAPKNNITVVGDDDQSIYKFRGASVSNILEFKDCYHDAKEIFLTTNYRSAQSILDLAYTFIQQNNPDRLEWKLRGSNLSKKLLSTTREKGTIAYLTSEDAEDEARIVVQTMRELLLSEKAKSLSDIAILVRSNDAATFFISALSDAELDYQYVASRGLFTKSVVIDVVSYLKLLDDYHESPALYRILSSPYLDVPQKDIVKLSHLAKRKSQSLFEVISSYHGKITVEKKTKETLAKLTRLIAKHSELAKSRSPHALLIQVLVDLGIQKHLDSRPSYENHQKLWQLAQLFREMASFSSRQSGARLKDFMEYLSLLLESGEEGNLPSPGDEGPHAVSIMTIHSAKGLEFEYVFIPQLVDKRFPTIERGDPIEIPDALVRERLPEGDAHLEEERRLFYVAVTRAKRGLFFSSAKNYGGVTTKKPSRFLYEVGLISKEERRNVRENLLVTHTQTVPKRMRGGGDAWHPPLPKQLSFSQFKAFETCPWQYRYAFLLHIPVKGRATYSFGQTMHTTLLSLYTLALGRQKSAPSLFNTKGTQKKLKELVSFRELAALYEKHWQDDWFDSKAEHDEYHAKGLSELKAFYEKEGEESRLPSALEESFMVKLGPWAVKGRIDRIDEYDDTVEVIDYKTGRAKEGGELSPDDKLQLILYELALLSQPRFQGKRFLLSYYFLSSTSKVSFSVGNDELEKTRERLTRLCEKIHTSDFTATPSKYICGACDFRDICPFRAV